MSDLFEEVFFFTSFVFLVGTVCYAIVTNSQNQFREYIYNLLAKEEITNKLLEGTYNELMQLPEFKHVWFRQVNENTFEFWDKGKNTICIQIAQELKEVKCTQ